HSAPSTVSLHDALPISRAITDTNIVSDLTRRIRDEEQQELAFEAERAAYDLIFAHRGKLEEFAQELLEREVLERPEIDRIMEGVDRKSTRLNSSHQVIS